MINELTKPGGAKLNKSPFGRWLGNILIDWDKTQLALSIIILAIIATTPLYIKSPYYMGIVILTVLYALVGVSWNIVAGFAGQLVIAHILFVAFGAYTTVALYDNFGLSPWIGIPISGMVSAMVGAIVAFITLRYGLKMDYFALFTIALVTAMKAVFLKWDFVGGAKGIGISLKDPTISKMIFVDKEPYLYIALVLLLIGLILQFIIYRSKMGKYFLAIREDDAAAAALGVDTSKYKTLALLISSAMAGVAGGFYIMYVTFIESGQVFSMTLNVEMVLAGPIIGGLGSLIGPLLGAIINKPLAELFRGLLSFSRDGSSLIVYGSFLILAILFMPRGIAGVLHTPYLKLRARIVGEEKK
jgi:branched-chain amino acid transport system permease protein